MAEHRRGKGEGSIYRRKDGRWVGQYEVNGNRRYVYGQTRKEVSGDSPSLSVLTMMRAQNVTLRLLAAATI